MATGIGKRVTAAVQSMDNEDAEGALHDICSAIEATATKENGRGGRSSYKEFIHNNLDIITKFGLGNSILNIDLEFQFQNPHMTANPDGTFPIQEILYHVVRCGLYHEGGLPLAVAFSKEAEFSVDDDQLTLPSPLIHGLIVAVVTSPANAQELFPTGGIKAGGIEIPFSVLRGKKKELQTLLEALDQVRRAMRPFVGNSQS